jgi:hypothetical protein
MKATLYKTGNDYLLRDDKGETLAITGGTMEGKMLSKSNCDEIFGVVDIEKLAVDLFHTVGNEGISNIDSYLKGFNKHKELNKDKLFTIEDMRKLGEFMIPDTDFVNDATREGMREDMELIIKSLSQSTEIEVEIVMDSNGVDKVQTKSISSNSIETLYLSNKPMTQIEAKKYWDERKPKLDSQSCLILKKI